MSDLVAISLFLKSSLQFGDALCRRRIINPNTFIIFTIQTDEFAGGMFTFKHVIQFAGP